MVIIFPLTGLIFFAVGLGSRNSAKSHLPDAEFGLPSGLIIAFHWLFIVAISGVGGFLISYSLFPQPTTARYCASILNVIASIVLYVLYLVFYFNSPEYSASTNGWTIPTFEENVKQMIQRQPYIRYEGYVEDNYLTCTMNGPKDVYLVNSSDASIIPNVTANVQAGDLIFVRIDLVIRYAPGQEQYVSGWQKMIVSCAPVAWVVWDGITYAEMIQSYVSGAFVTKDGQIPSSVGKGAAIASGIFWAGIMHAYLVDAVPMMPMKVIKENARFNELPACGTVPGFYCRTKSSTTRRR